MYITSGTFGVHPLSIWTTSTSHSPRLEEVIHEDLLHALETWTTSRILLGVIAGQLHAFHVRCDIFDLGTSASRTIGGKPLEYAQ